MRSSKSIESERISTAQLIARCRELRAQAKKLVCRSEKLCDEIRVQQRGRAASGMGGNHEPNSSP
jgi:hypothetical protein